MPERGLVCDVLLPEFTAHSTKAKTLTGGNGVWCGQLPGCGIRQPWATEGRVLPPCPGKGVTGPSHRVQVPGLVGMNRALCLAFSSEQQGQWGP